MHSLGRPHLTVPQLYFKLNLCVLNLITALFSESISLLFTPQIYYSIRSSLVSHDLTCICYHMYPSKTLVSTDTIIKVNCVFVKCVSPTRYHTVVELTTFKLINCITLLRSTRGLMYDSWLSVPVGIHGVCCDLGVRWVVVGLCDAVCQSDGLFVVRRFSDQPQIFH